MLQRDLYINPALVREALMRIQHIRWKCNKHVCGCTKSRRTGLDCVGGR